MHILIAPDSFKGSLSSPQVADRIAAGILNILPGAGITKVPVADGGEGTVEAMLAAVGGRRIAETVTGPLGEPVRAEYGILADGTAVIEMAAASGLPLVPEDRRDPLAATTYGTGQLIRAALDRGCRRMILGIGGSATNDGGAGMAQALGVSLLDGTGGELPPGGGALDGLRRIDLGGLDPRVGESRITIACDVKNPLCGPRGASRIFGPQKGADGEMAARLDDSLRHFADTVRDQLGRDLMETPGAGAAGGLGFGLMAFLGAEMGSGIDTVLDVAGVDALLPEMDLVITGEGRMDGQSVFGKVPVGVAARAKRHHLPVLAIVGGIGPGADAVYGHGIDAVMSIAEGPLSLPEAMDRAGELLESAAGRAMRMILLGQGLRK